MLRRLGSVALVLVTSMAVVVEPVWAGPPAPGLPDPEAAPIEGPAPPPGDPSSEPPPSELPPPTIEPEPHEGGSIEFAVPPPETNEPSSTGPTPTLAPPKPASPHEDLGKAPNSGGAFLAGGIWLVPMSTYATVVLVQQNLGSQYNPRASSAGIITAGAGLGAIGLSMLGVGAYRLVMLGRWGKRHRVVTLPQGSGLVTSGTLALLFGAGVLVAAIKDSNPITGAVAGAMLVSAPIQIGVGSSFARRYQRTGGWRPTRYTISPLGLRVQF
ncbi:hypothetical protein ACNOYE_29205 [Nannocystaceae bacterium ST9]